MEFLINILLPYMKEQALLRSSRCACACEVFLYHVFEIKKKLRKNFKKRYNEYSPGSLLCICLKESLQII